VEAIKVLLEHGANVDATTRMDETVLGQPCVSIVTLYCHLLLANAIPVDMQTLKAEYCTYRVNVSN